MQREWLNENCKQSQFCNDFDHGEWEELHLPAVSCNGDGPRYKKNSLLVSTTNVYPFPFSSSSTTTTASSGGFSFIQHPVSRLDTLAGIAIKYGVEISDIRKINGLVTDLQMFALKSLQIPLPGRHPPSPGVSNSGDTTRFCRQNSSQQTSPCSDLINSFQSSRLQSPQVKVSPAMSSLQGYYGIKSVTDPKIPQGSERDVYSKGFSDVKYLTPLPVSGTPLNRNRKSKSVVINGFLDENNGLADSQLSSEVRESDVEKWNEKLVRSCCSQPETLMQEDSNGGVSSAITGKSLALRSNAASRTVCTADAETTGLAPVPVNSVDIGGYSGVRKSSSTSNLHDQDSSISSIWETSKWSLKQDLQSLSVAAIGRPIFDGLPKPGTGRRNKAAID